MLWPAETQSHWGPSGKPQTIYLKTVSSGKGQDGIYNHWQSSLTGWGLPMEAWTPWPFWASLCGLSKQLWHGSKPSGRHKCLRWEASCDHTAGKLRSRCKLCGVRHQQHQLHSYAHFKPPHLCDHKNTNILLSPPQCLVDLSTLSVSLFIHYFTNHHISTSNIDTELILNIIYSLLINIIQKTKETYAWYNLSFFWPVCP